MSHKLKILLAEDDPSLSRYIQTILSRWDCDLAVEQTAERAISRAVTFKPDVALLGFITPGMDGAKAGIELLKDSPETRIVLTVESVPSEVLDALRAQEYDFRTLVAPFNIEELQSLCFPSSNPKTG
jgi:DNA-binding response OmpR family regulator